MYRFVEDKIKESIDNGEFDNLPGKGKPLNLKEDLQGLSPEIRRAYKLLKNAGYIDEETEKKKKDLEIDDLITAATGKSYKSEAQSRQKFEAFVKEQKLNKNKKFSAYAKKIYKKFF